MGMKHIITAAASMALSIGVFTGTAFAQSNSCPSGTIQKSKIGTAITCVTETNTRATCVNNVYVVGENGQSAASGNASVSGNGVAVSGSATNDSGEKISIGAHCNATPASTPSTPSGGTGSGGGTTPSNSGNTSNPTSSPSAPANAQQITSTPVGAVHAGGGAGAQTSPLTVTGLISSATALGIGAGILLKRHIIHTL